MKSDFLAYQDYHEIASSLNENYSELSKFEALSLAIQIQRNQILSAGLAVSHSDSRPTGLEAISISLGFGDLSVATALTDIADILNNQNDNE